MDHGIITDLIHLMQTLLTNYGAFTVGISVFFLGENAALAVFALAAQGFISPTTALIWAFVGSMSSDIFWFFIAENILKSRYEKRLQEATKSKSNRFFMRLVDKHFFWTLIFIKFLVGMRLILTIYIVLKNKIPFSTKILLNALGTLLFMGVLFPLGWYLGKGVSSALSIEQNIIRTLSAIVGIIIFSHFVPKIISKLIDHFYKEHDDPHKKLA